MSYQISYNPEDNHKYPICRKLKRGMWLRWGIVFLVLLGLAGAPKVRCKMESLLIPGDAQVTKNAFSFMLEQIQTGEPIEEAVSAFCREIIKNGNQAQSLDT